MAHRFDKINEDQVDLFMSFRIKNPKRVDLDNKDLFQSFKVGNKPIEKILVKQILPIIQENCIESESFTPTNSKIIAQNPMNMDTILNSDNFDNKNFNDTVVNNSSSNEEGKIENIFLVKKEKNDTFVLKVIFKNKKPRLILRKKQDFDFLNNLKIEFPYLFVPPLKIEKNQKKMISNFFEKLFANNLGRNSKILETFSDNEKFDKVKKQKNYLEEEMTINKMNLMFLNKIKEINENEMFYDSFFNTIIEPFCRKKNNLNFYKILFEKIQNKFDVEKYELQNITVLFEKLNNLFAQSSETIKKISFSLNKYFENSKSFFNKMKIKKNENFEFIQKNFLKGLDSWAQYFTKSKKIIKKNIISLFNIKKEEAQQFSDIIKGRLNTLKQSITRLEEIKYKKEEIFYIKDYTKWNINKDINVGKMLDVFNDFEKAKNIMLTDVR